MDITDHFLWPLGILLIAFASGFLLVALLFRLLRLYRARNQGLTLESIQRNLRRPLRFLVPILLTAIAVPLADLRPDLEAVVAQALEILAYIGAAWLIIEATDVVGDLVRHQYRMEEGDNLHERKIITQMTYIKRVVGVVVIIIAVAFILMQFERVRELGAGLLTSAGIVGIVIGIAAQRPISNLLAGFQIAFTQPVRIDDVIVVEGEFGRVEEINLTYVVLKLWDQRRLILPLIYFLEKPFQNWTRNSAELLATVYLYTDYRLPVEALRAEFESVLEQTDLWDRRVKVLQVTDSKERTMEVRALFSAANSSHSWDLRCLVREKLITFIQTHFPESLPRTRVEFAAVQEPDVAPGNGHSVENAPGMSDSPETRVDRKNT